MLVKGLPPTALVRTPLAGRGREPWTAYHELLAQLIEITSIPAAEHRLNKPIQIPRPNQDPLDDEELTVRSAADSPGQNAAQRAIAALGGVQLPNRGPAPMRVEDEEQETA